MPRTKAKLKRWEVDKAVFTIVDERPKHQGQGGLFKGGYLSDMYRAFLETAVTGKAIKLALAGRTRNKATGYFYQLAKRYDVKCHTRLKAGDPYIYLWAEYKVAALDKHERAWAARQATPGANEWARAVVQAYALGLEPRKEDSHV